MNTRITDSPMYAHLWGSPEVRAVFDEQARLQTWLEVLAALARAQAAEGVIPAAAAESITRCARVDLLDLELVAEQTRASGHSTLGLIRGLEGVLPADVYPYVYVGASVQDLTDTATSIMLRTVGGYLWRDLRRIEELLLDLAERHRDTLMVGRTHAQPAAPITFGWKVASWADEIRRHLDRLKEGAPRWLVGQLGGGVGTLAGLGAAGLAVRARFCEELGLTDPGISWLTARDRIAEVGTLLAMITATVARIGTEICQLQRPEIGELSEPVVAGVVSSITMPHKQNPERSEHLATLARLVRANGNVLIEGMIGQHERDGSSWKAEWVALPEVCLLTSAALELARDVLEGVRVDAAAMAANIDSYAESEVALRLLSARLGASAARRVLHGALAGQPRTAATMSAVLRARELLTDAEVAALRPDPGAAAAMVDIVVARSRIAREQESHTWP